MVSVLPTVADAKASHASGSYVNLATDAMPVSDFYDSSDGDDDDSSHYSLAQVSPNDYIFYIYTIKHIFFSILYSSKAFHLCETKHVDY